MKRIKNKGIVVILVFAMLVTQVWTMPAFAENTDSEVTCNHVHDEACGYVEAKPEVPCDKNCVDTDGDGDIDHAEDCAYSPALEGSPCNHEHDETCGYKPSENDSPEEEEGEIVNPPVEEDKEEKKEQPLEEPSDDEEEVAPVAVADNGVRENIKVELVDSATSNRTNVDESGTVNWAYTKTMRLDVNVNSVNDLHGGTVKVSIAPGLNIQSLTAGSNFESTPVPKYTDPETSGMPNYPQANLKSGVVEYKVRESATELYFSLTLEPDKLLMPKLKARGTGTGLKDWLISEAIKIEFFDSDDVAQGHFNTNVKITDDSDASKFIWGEVWSTLKTDTTPTVPSVREREFSMAPSYYIYPTYHSGVIYGSYVKKLVFTMPIPKTASGTYAQYVRVTTSGVPAVTGKVDPGAHTVTFTWENINWPSIGYITPYFKWDQDVPPGTGVTLENTVSVKATYYGSAEENTFYVNGPAAQKDYVTSEPVQLTVNPCNRNALGKDFFNSGTDNTYYLGQWSFKNQGYEETGPLTLDFTYSSQSLVRYTAQEIPTPLMNGKRTIASIEWKTKNVPGGGTVSDINSTGDEYLFKLSDLESKGVDPKTDSLTSISVKLSDGFPAGYSSHSDNIIYHPYSGHAVTYGVPVNNSSAGSVSATLKITQDEGSKLSAQNTFTNNMVITGEQMPAMNVQKAGSNFFDTQSVQLEGTTGGTVHFSGYIGVTELAYNNCNIVERPVIFVRLPNTIKVKEKSWKLTSAATGVGDTPISDGSYEVTEQRGSGNRGENIAFGGDGYHVYKIVFKDDSGKIGWYNDAINQTRLKVEFDLDIANTTPDTTLKVGDMIFVAHDDSGEYKASAGIGVWSTYQMKDVYKLGGSDKDYGELFTVGASDTNSLQIIATRVGLTFDSHAKLESEPADSWKNYKVPTINGEDMEADGHVMYITKESDRMMLRLRAQNTSGEKITITKKDPGQEEFFYYIPVPKEGDFWEENSGQTPHMQDEAFGFNMNLAAASNIDDEPVKIQGGEAGKFEVRYSTSVKAGVEPSDPAYYSKDDAESLNAAYKTWTGFKSENDWNSKSEAEKKELLSKVKMIRVSVKQDTVELAEDTDVTFEITYDFHSDAGQLVGQFIEFGPCGVTSYNRNGQPSSGHSPTQRIRAEIQTGRVAGRIFIDEDFDGKFSENDSLLRYDSEADPPYFYTENAYPKWNGNPDTYKNLEYDEAAGEKKLDDFSISLTAKAKSMEGEADSVTHTAHRADFEANGVKNAFDNTYAITGLRAAKYTVTMTNPKYAAGAPGADSLRFIALDKETGSTRPVNNDASRDKTAEASTYTLSNNGYQDKVDFDVNIISDPDNVTKNRMMDIGLQRPHTVTFRIEYYDEYPLNRASSFEEKKVYVWHNTTVEESGGTAPDITRDDYKWDGGTPEWTADADDLTTESGIDKDVTFTARAVRMEHQVKYELNGGSGTGFDPVPAVHGQTVTLNTDKPTRSNVEGKKVAFIGWSLTDSDTVYERGNAKGDPAGVTTVSQVTMNTGDITVYAIWGYDSDGDGIPDAQENRYSFTYDANGGANPPAKEGNLINGDSVTIAKQGSMTAPRGNGNKVIFAGWTESEDVKGKIYGSADTGKHEDIDGKLMGESYTIGEKDATVYAVWAYDENNNDTPDYRETLQKLAYHDSLFEDGVLQEKAKTEKGLDQKEYLTNKRVTLWSDANKGTANAWKARYRNRGIVFVGWTEVEDNGKTVLKNAPGPGVITDSVTIGDSLKEVYAVWAWDLNGNGNPDYDDPGFVVHFDLNGGTGGAKPEDVVTVKEASVTLPAEPAEKWTKENNVFAGWSKTKTTDPVDRDGNSGEHNVNDLLLESYKTPDEGMEETLFAVYAQDINGDKVPDYLEDAQRVAYYPNGGSNPDGNPAYTDDSAFYKCPHRHIKNERNVALLSTDDGKQKIRREKAVLIGWSLTPLELITKDNRDANRANLVTTVDIPDEGDAKVYAVWAADKNGNDIPDYEENELHQWYYFNKALKDWKADGDTVHGQDAPEAVTEVNPAGVETVTITRGGYGDAGVAATLPTDGKLYLPGEKATVSGMDGNRGMAGADQTFFRVDKDAAGEVLHRYVQVGWSGFAHYTARTAQEALNWVHFDQDTASANTTERTVVGATYQYNFVVWAYDENGNGIPDYSEGNLRVTKTVSGSFGEKDRDFHFTVQFGQNGGLQYVAVTKNGQPYTEAVIDGERKLEITLKDGDYVDITGLPIGITYAVDELEENQDGYATTYTDDIGTINSDQDMVAAFVNDKPEPANPGNTPDNPNNPANPDNPNSPGNTDNPNSSVNTDNPNGGGNTPDRTDGTGGTRPGDEPDTGDDSHLGLWLMLLLLSISGLMVFIPYRRRESGKGKN